MLSSALVILPTVKLKFLNFNISFHSNIGIRNTFEFKFEYDSNHILTSDLFFKF